jgi:peptidoglycan/xylan/chitin deacetylase (PgdA/CDA1 family)
MPFRRLKLAVSGSEPIISDDPEADPRYRMVESGIKEHWPEELDLAVCLSFDTQGAIDGLRDGYQTTTWPGGAPNWWDYTERQYGVRRGLPRLLDILDEHGIRATFPTCGMTAEWYPDRIAEIADRGHEIASHTHTHRLLYELDEAEHRREVERSTEILEEVTGQRPTGWRSPVYSTSSDTVDLLCEYGYGWDSSFHNHDFPYVLESGDRRLLELPVNFDDWTLYLMSTASNEGMHMGGYPRGTPDGVLNVLKSEFDRLYKEGREYGEPRSFMYTMHPKVTGRPHRAESLARFIEYAQGKPGVHFLTGGELAAIAAGDVE